MDQIPSGFDLGELSLPEFLRTFEAARLQAMRRVLLESGLTSEKPCDVLDFGYLHGLVPEFLSRAFPLMSFTICDHPQSPVFQSPEYLNVIGTRSYLTLQPLEIDQAGTLGRQFDLIILGEIIEHLDPTVVARVLKIVRGLLQPGGLLLVTTPNATSIKNAVYGLAGRDAEHPPIPNAIMGWGHIHLWSYNLLRRTMEAHGWSPVRAEYFHGTDEQEFAQANRTWGSLRWQCLTRGLFLIASLVPRWRGFMVNSWRPTPTAA